MSEIPRWADGRIRRYLTAGRSGVGGVFPQEAVRVRLNRSLFPADLITISPNPGRFLRDVHLWQHAGNDVLKALGGGGPAFDDLGPGDFIDVFVHGGEASNLEVPPLRHASLALLREGRPLVVTMDWLETGNERGRLYIAWTSEDRRDGRAPRLAFGEDARVLTQYFMEPGVPVTAALLRQGRRVPLMTTRDIRRRGRQERRGEAMTHGAPRITSVAVRGFRGFREEASLQLAQPTGAPGSGLTVVVGANNTGKSTMWESFDALSRKSAVSFSAGRRNLLTPGGVRIQLRRADESVYTLASRSLSTSETRTEWDPSSAGAVPFEIVSVPSRRQFEASFGRNSTAQRDWMALGPEFTRNRQPSQMSQFTGRLFDLHNDPEKKQAFDQLMEEVVGYPIDWTIDLGDGQYGQSYFLKVTTGDGVNHTSEGLGDGIISLIFILDALYDSQETTLLVIDEPELSLHPQLVRRLGQVLARYAADRQIVVFTHSPSLVSWDHIAAGAEIARVYKDGPDSRLAQVRRETIAEVSKARGNWRVPHTLGQDANEALFLDDRIIVVEGAEDAALLPTVAELAGVGLKGNIFGWGAGGKDNVPKIVALLEDLGFKKIAAVLDNNAQEAVQRIRDAHPGVLVEEIPAADIRDKPDKGVTGLLDERGKVLREDLKEPARQVLERLAQFLDSEDVRPVAT